MSKVVLIRRKNESDWISCQSITSNLEASYKSFIKDIIIIDIESDYNKYDYYKKAEEILSHNPANIIFIDHTPHPHQLIKSLFSLSKVELHFTFHIFGDFTLQSSHWIGLEDILKQTNNKFICASHKQTNLLKNLVDGLEENLFTVPFPVDTNIFNYKEKEISSEKFRFLYTGRLSDQKNIIELITLFNHFNLNINSNTELIISGPYDDLGIPFLGKKMKSGAYGLTVESLVERLNNPNIQIIGNLNHDDLVNYYQSSDAFISISTHNDEDYGMSPAEALCSGLPCLLTNWAGYTSFKLYCPSSVYLSPVDIQNHKNLPNKSDIIKKMTLLASSKLSSKQRFDLSTTAQSTLGISSVTESLREIAEKDFTLGKSLSFTERFKALSSSHIYSPDTPFLKASNGEYNSLYKDVYWPYYEEEINEK